MENKHFETSLEYQSRARPPILLAAAQFFWDDGRVTTTAGVLQVLAFTVWIFSFQGLFQVIRKDLPTYSVIGFILAAYACIGGNNFGWMVYILRPWVSPIWKQLLNLPEV